MVAVFLAFASLILLGAAFGYVGMTDAATWALTAGALGMVATAAYSWGGHNAERKRRH